jgi:D-alanyl-D-alanine carboxypeptidase
MLAICTCALTLAAIAAERAADPSPFPAAKKAAIDATLARAMAQVKAPGAVVGIWIPGEGSYVAALGMSDPVAKKPMRIDDRFRIGAITRTFTVTSLLQLVDEKKVRLDDPVSKYVDDVPNGDKITLRMLANMTSGLHSYSEDPAWIDEAMRNPQRAWTPRELVDAAFRHPPDFPPGGSVHDSDTNSVLIGMVVQKVTRRPVRVVLRDRIQRPLGLKQTTWPISGRMPKPFARGITTQTPDGKPVDATNRNPSFAFSAGQLVSTLDDMRTWIRLFATGALVSPALRGERFGAVDNHGWLGASGRMPGYSSSAYYLPQKDATVVVLVNSDVPVDSAEPATILLKAMLKEAMPANTID